MEIPSDWKLLSQGAEARVWKTTEQSIAKERFAKAYRHPTLDRRLTQQRSRAEARILEKCRAKGLKVPQVLRVEGNTLFLEYLEAPTVRTALEDKLDGGGDGVDELAQAMGTAIGRLHSHGMIHGDLTTSNMLLDTETGDLYLIDFGLAKNTQSAEERAVDLYVVERALQSTHPRLSDQFGATVLEAYAQTLGSDAKPTLQRLEQVRQRGRKRECFG